MQHVPHIRRPHIRQHDKLDTRRRLVVMQLILARPIRDEGVVLPPELAHHVPQREDRAEDEFGVVLGGEARDAGARWVGVVEGHGVEGLRGGGAGARAGGGGERARGLRL